MRTLSVALTCFLFVTPPAHAALVNLGSASSFAVLGASTVTNTGPAIIHGNLGVSPGTAITGFPPGTVTGGAIHAGDAVAGLAHTDLAAAYAAAAATSCGTALTGQDLGGLTLTPGTYCFASTAALTGILTLDGLGDPNAAFLFQVGSALTTASASSIVFANGAGSNALYWQVGSSATLGTTSAFAGTIMAQASITMNTGASLTCGQALALTSAVTLDTNFVSIDSRDCPIEGPGVVPEPDTWALLVIGFAAAGTALRRRRLQPRPR